MFRNLRLYQMEGQWPKTESELSSALQENAFEPCGKFTEKSAGFEAPGGEENTLLCRRVMGADLLQLRTQSRIIPLAAVKEALESRVAQFRQRTRLDPPRREMTRMKLEVRDELISRALLKSERSRALVVPDTSLMVIDVATVSKAEWLIDQLRPCLPSVRWIPLEFSGAVDGLLKRMFQGQLPKGFGLGTECRMQSLADAHSTGVWRNVDLGDAAIQRHVQDGMRLTHLGFVFEEFISGVLAEDGSIGKFDLGTQQENEHQQDQHPLAALDAEIALLAGAITRLLPALQKAFKAQS